MQNKLRSASSNPSAALLARVREAFALARMHWRKRNQPTDFSHFPRFAERYDAIARQYLGRGLRELKLVEIGYGARPLRLAWLYSSGVDVVGIDLDAPVIGLDAVQLFKAFRVNGAQRALKSLGRQLIVGDAEWRDLAAEFTRRYPGKQFRVPKERLLVGDAADPELWRGVGPVQFIYSEDVFEHIPADGLPKVLRQMRATLGADGVAVIKPLVFTGITGGHNVEWYPHTFATPRKRATRPWEHLRDDGVQGNTYLNRLRFADYVALFEQDFDILHIDKGDPNLGAQFLDDEVRAALPNYTEEELMLNDVLFVLKPRASVANAPA